VNRRLAEGAARVDRHHLIRLAADHDLVVRLGRNTPTGRRDPHWKRHINSEDSPWRCDEVTASYLFYCIERIFDSS
jgi:hypothetical protein